MFRKKLAEKLIVEQRPELRKKLVSEKLKERTNNRQVNTQEQDTNER